MTGPHGESTTIRMATGPPNLALVVQVWKQRYLSLGLEDELDMDLNRLVSGEGGGEEKEEYKEWKQNIENRTDTHMSIRQTDAFRA